MGLAIILISAACIHAAAPTVVAYKDLPTQIFTQNGVVQSKLSEGNAAKSRTGYLDRSFLPHLGLTVGGEAFQTAGTERYTQPYGSLALSMNLYQGGRDAQEDVLRQQYVAQSVIDIQQAYISELSVAQRQYWQIVAISETIRHYEDMQSRLRLATKAAKYRVSRGLTTGTDILEFARYEDIATEQIEILNQEKKQLSLTLATQLGLTTEIIITETRVPDPDDQVLQTATLRAEKQPDLATLQNELAILTMEKKKLSLRNLPSIDLYNTYTAYTSLDRDYANITDRFDVAAGIRMHMPLFDDAQSEKEADALSYKITAKTQLLEQQTKTLQRMMQSTQAQLGYLEQATHRSQKRVNQTALFLKATLADYDQGLKNASDVRNAIETYFHDKTESTQRRLAYQLTKVDLLALSTYDWGK